MGLKDIVKPLEDVFNPDLDVAVAPSLGKVYGYVVGDYRAETPADESMLELYGDPDRFFSVTYVTEGIEKVFSEILDALEKGSKGIIVLPSLFGGGKTHTLLAVFHAFRKPEALLKSEPRDVANTLYHRVKSILEKSRDLDIVVVDGDYERYAPSPTKPLHIGVYSVHSVWGYIAHCLGRYDIVRSYDVEFKAPSKDSLEKLFEGKHAIILMDEMLSGYVLNLDDVQKSRYLEFFRRLAGAVQGKRIAVVLTIPVRIRGEGKGIEVEEQYKIIEDFVKGISEALREQAVIIPPLRTEIDKANEVVRVLRKRIFGSADIKMPDDVLRYYQGVFSLELFPAIARNIDLLYAYYPFHPSYVEVLLEHISERRPRIFQRTRFAILLTRKVVRNIWRSDRKPDFIHVWNIDLEDKEVAEIIIGKLRDVENKDYSVYLSKLYDRARHSSEPALAKDLITTIFLRTFLYEGAPEALKAYPTEREVYWMVYDRDYGVEPARLQKVLEALLGDPEVSYISRHEEGKVYFTTLIDIGDVLKKRKDEALRRSVAKVYEKMKDLLEEVLVAKDEESEPFSKEGVIFLTSEELLAGYRPEESPKHRVLVYLGTLRGEQAGELILGYKNYRNTTVVLDSPDKDRFNELLDLAAWLYVIDEVRKRKELEVLYRDKNARKWNEFKLRDIEKSKRDELKKLAPEVFKRVWYPAGGKVPYAEAPPKKSLLGNVYTALKSGGVNKILDPEEVDLKIFLKKLAEVGFDLESNWYQVSSIVDLFLRNPRIWMANRNMVLRVLKRLYEGLELAVMRGGRIYWKSICEGEEQRKRVEQCTGGPHRTIADFQDVDLVARVEYAFREYVDQLLKDEGEVREPSKILRKYYVVLTDEGPYRLRDLYNAHKEDLGKLYQVLKDPRNRLLLKEEVIGKGFDVRLSNGYIETEPRRSIEVEVFVDVVDGFSEEVKLEVDRGVVEPSAGVPPFKAVWRLTPEDVEGTYTYRIRASGGGLERGAQLSVKVVGEYEVMSTDFSGYEPRPGDVIEEVDNIRNIGTLQTIIERLRTLTEATSITLSMSATGYEGRLKISVEGISVEESKDIIEALNTLRNISVNARVTFQNAKPLDEQKVSRLKALKNILSGIRVRVKRKRA